MTMSMTMTMTMNMTLTVEKPYFDPRLVFVAPKPCQNIHHMTMTMTMVMTMSLTIIMHLRTLYRPH